MQLDFASLGRLLRSCSEGFVASYDVWQGQTMTCQNLRFMCLFMRSHGDFSSATEGHAATEVGKWRVVLLHLREWPEWFRPIAVHHSDRRCYHLLSPVDVS